jgi:hypothetical protein
MAEFWVASSIAVVLLGYASWVGLAPRRRLTRLGAILSACSVVAWAIYLVFGESSGPNARTVLPDGSIELWHDAPVMVAGRLVGTFGSVNFADRILTPAAHPAILYSWQVVMLASGIEAKGSVSHSYIVAGMSAVLAGAFWLAVGNGIAAVRARRASRRAVARQQSAAV